MIDLSFITKSNSNWTLVFEHKFYAKFVFTWKCERTIVCTLVYKVQEIRALFDLILMQIISKYQKAISSQRITWTGEIFIIIVWIQATS